MTVEDQIVEINQKLDAISTKLDANLQPATDLTQVLNAIADVRAQFDATPASDTGASAA